MKSTITSALILLFISSASAQHVDGGIKYQLKRAERLMQQKNYPAAIKWLENAKTKLDHEPGIHAYLGNCFFALDQLEDAVRSYRRSAELAPALVAGIPNYPYALLKLNRPDEAELIYRKLSDSEQQASRAQGEFGLGLVAVHRGDHKGALKHFEVARKLNPQARKILYRLGLAQSSLQLRDEAIESFRTLYELDRLHLAAAHNLSLLYARKKEMKEARHWRAVHRAIYRTLERIEQLKGGLQKRPGDVAILRELADINFQHRRFNEAKSLFIPVVASNPRIPEPRFMVASCLFELGDYHPARLQLEQVLRFDSKFQPARELHARILAMFPDDK